MKAPRLYICRDINKQGGCEGRLRIFIGRKPMLNDDGVWCNYSASADDFKVAIPREMFPDIMAGDYMTYDAGESEEQKEGGES